MKKIVYLPLDERPCNALFVPKLFNGEQLQVVIPPKMGYKKTPAAWDDIRDFMLTECAVDVKNIREYIGAHPGEDAGTLAKGFNETHPGHPPISGYTVGRFLEEFR